MALPFLEQMLAAELASQGRSDLMEKAVGRVALTDDGATIYVHLFPRKDWPHRLPGRAYVLSWHDYTDVQKMDCLRWLIREAKLNLHDHAKDIVRWLEGK